MKQYDAVIIGGGSAGLAAAISLKENGIENIIVLEKDTEAGGILQQCIHKASVFRPSRNSSQALLTPSDL